MVQRRSGVDVLVTRCGHCQGTDNLARCTKCRVMFYCNREHQAAHRPEHKTVCNKVAKKRQELANEEAKLRSLQPGFMIPAGVFENAVGHFWGILETRPYMRARYALVDTMTSMQTHEAEKTRLDHLMDMLRLCRSDNLGVRDQVPWLMLRLNRDQECYDFLKWYNTDGDRSDYDWGDMDLPYLNIKGADVFESVDYMCKRYMRLSHGACMMLLKAKMLLDLTALQRSVAESEGMPGEVLNCVQQHIVRTPLITANRDLMNGNNLQEVINKLTAQITQLYKAVHETNKYYWPAVEDPAEYIETRPSAYSPGSVQETQLVLRYSLDAWEDIPGALEVIRKRNRG